MLCTSRALPFDEDTAALQCLDGKNNNAASRRSQRQTAAGSSGSAHQSSNGSRKQHRWRGRQSRQADVIEPCHRLPSSVARLEIAAHHCSKTLGNIDLPFPPLGLRKGGRGTVGQTERQRSRLSCLSGLGEELTLYSSNRKQDVHVEMNAVSTHFTSLCSIVSSCIFKGPVCDVPKASVGWKWNDNARVIYFTKNK